MGTVGSMGLALSVAAYHKFDKWQTQSASTVSLDVKASAKGGTCYGGRRKGQGSGQQLL